MAVESDLEELKKDCAELVGLTPPADKEKADETPATPPAKEDQAEKPVESKAEDTPPEKPAETPPKKDEEESRWDKPLQREQQKRAALEKEVAALKEAQAKRDKEWKKLLEVNGIEPEPDEPPPPATPPAETPPADASTPSEEARMELATAQRERLFAKIERQNPTFDADKVWSDSISEVLELHGIDPKSTELPEGLTMAALETAAGKVFNRKLTAHKEPPPAPPTAPRKPPTTRGGNAGTQKHVSHVPAASPTTPDTYDFRQECQKLTGQLEE